MNREMIVETIVKLFVGVDERNWILVKQVFCDFVLLDYSSMSSAKAEVLTPDKIIENWRNFLPGFDFTHHHIGNFMINLNPETAEVFCYGTATHYLKNESNSNIWTVVGSYNFDLQHFEEGWKISKMKFNFKFADGNFDLPKLAQERLLSNI